MAMITSQVPRVLHIGGVVVAPGVPVEVPDEALKGKRVAQLLKDKEIVKGEKPGTPETEGDEGAKLKAAEAAAQAAQAPASNPAAAPTGAKAATNTAASKP